MLIYDQCPQSVVVRTLETRDVSGRIGFKREWRSKNTEKMFFLEPGASLTRGGVTCHETKLSLYEAQAAYDAKNASRTRYERVSVQHVLPGTLAITETTQYVPRRDEASTLDLAAEPFEVATGAKDAISGQVFVWRAAISIQRFKELWLVTVRDVSGEKSVDLCTFGSKTLDPKVQKEDFPLQRLTKKVVEKPQNAWEHLMSDDD